ncbi:hypothetical protein [Paenibacillus sp. H1-7]|uniref:hypothetical protein n=1 Tax=Paenibacillus sp. H1-7 TaxID=2282849 RepID=UPI0031F3007C
MNKPKLSTPSPRPFAMRKAAAAIVITALLLTACGKAAPAGTAQDAASKPEQNAHAGHGAAPAPKEADVKAAFTFSPDKPQAGKDTLISLQVTDSANKPVEKFDINHEKTMHLIIVSKDLSYFNHIHPDYKEKGLFTIANPFPAGGDYKLFADFVPSGQSGTTKSQWTTIQGDAAKPAAIQPDGNLTKTVDGKEISLAFDKLQAGKEVNLIFNIKDGGTKKPITNLQQYLGAVGHVVILSEDAEQYLHVHPTEEKATGPDAKFMTTFPKSGIYKIWGQFQHEGKVFTVPFVVKVP